MALGLGATPTIFAGHEDLQLWLRNSTYRGDYVQLRDEAVEPQRRRKLANRKRKSSVRERPREQWQHVTVPAVVPHEQWQAAQERLTRNKTLATRNAKRTYLLQGLVRCGQCGAHMVGWFRDYTYYRCSHYRRPNMHGQDCRWPPVRAEGLEEAVWDRLQGLLQDPDSLVAELQRRQAEGGGGDERPETQRRRPGEARRIDPVGVLQVGADVGVRVVDP